MMNSEELKKALLEAKKQLGEDVLRDGRKMVAAVADIAPSLKKEKSVLLNLTSADGHTALYTAFMKKEDGQREIRKQVKKLADNYAVDPAAAEEVCIAYWEAIGGRPVPKKEHPGGETVTPPAPPEPPVSKPKSKKTAGIILAAVILVAAVIVFKANGKTIRISFNSGTGSSTAVRTTAAVSASEAGSSTAASTTSIGSGTYEQGFESMTHEAAQRLFPGISSSIIIPVDINDFSDYAVTVKASAYKRYSWHVYNDGKSHNFGVVGKNNTSATCCASFKDTDGVVNYLLYDNGEYFWVRASMVK